MTFKLNKARLNFRLDGDAAFNKGRSETFPERRKFPADYSPKNSLEAVVEQKKWFCIAHWFIRGNVVKYQ